MLPRKWARTIPKGAVLVVEGQEMPSPRKHRSWWKEAVSDPEGFRQRAAARGGASWVLQLGLLGVRPNTYRGYWSGVARLLVWMGWGLEVSDSIPNKEWSTAMVYSGQATCCRC